MCSKMSEMLVRLFCEMYQQLMSKYCGLTPAVTHNALTHADLGGPEVIIPLEPASLTGGNTIYRAVGKRPQHLRKHCVCFVWGFFYAFFLLSFIFNWLFFGVFFFILIIRFFFFLFFLVFLIYLF